MTNFINKVVAKFNAGLAYVFRMNAYEWIFFACGLLAVFFMVSHPLTTILLFVVVWFASVGFRNTIKKFFSGK